jgi:hypothetical protein
MFKLSGLILIFCFTFAAGKEVSFPEPQGDYSAFRRSLNNHTAYGRRVVQAPSPVRAGKFAERFELHSGDCGAAPDWNDCTNDRERSELIQQKPYSKPNQVYWYAWSFFIPSDYKNIFPVKVALGQFIQEDQPKPPLMFQNGSGGYAVEAVQLEKKPFLLIAEKDLRGRWHDLMLSALWSTGKDGFFKIWVDGKLKFTHHGPTLKHTEPVLFKYGIYRSFLSRFPHGKKIPDQTVYFDEVKWGKSRASVQIP